MCAQPGRMTLESLMTQLTPGVGSCASENKSELHGQDHTPSMLHPPGHRDTQSFYRQPWFQISTAVGLSLTLYATKFERHNIEVTQREITLRRLPRALDGVRLVQLTDFHYRHYAETSYLRRVVQEVNRLAPDVVLLTGDFVSELTFGSCKHSAELSLPCAEILSAIKCPHRFAVLGNHDHMVGPDIIARGLEIHGFPVLQNRYAAFHRDGARLWIAGVESAAKGSPDLHAAVPQKLKASGDPVLLLAHEPDFADKAVEHGGIDLVLSGHSHGGQVRLPFVGALKLPPLGEKYVQGLFTFPGGMQLYVSRGIGAMKLPIRFMCRPEIAVLTLRSAPEPASRL